MLVYLVATYSVLIGVFMFSFWIYAVYSDIIPEEEKPWGIRFHLFSEFTTATMLTLSGIAQILMF